MAQNLRSDALEIPHEEGLDFHEVTDAIPDGVVIVNRGGRILFANPSAARLLGRSVQELKGTVFGYPVMASGRTKLTIGTHQVEMRVARATWRRQPAFLASLRDIAQQEPVEANMKSLSTALEKANGHLQRLATIDPLTHNGKPPPLAVRLEEVRPSRRAVLVDGLHQRTTTCELKETVIGEWQCQSHDGLYRIGRVTRRPRHWAKATGGL